jgi:apolipoprotein N-acyltransferase
VTPVAVREPLADGQSVVVYPPAWRIVAALLRVFARGSLLYVLYLMLFTQDPPTNPLRQMRLFGGLFLLPEAAAWCVARAFAAKMRVEDGALVIEQRERRTDIPLSAIAAVELWQVPLPMPGVWLGLRSGRRFAQGLAVADPDVFVASLDGQATGTDAFVASRDGEATAPAERAVLPGGMAAFLRARSANPPGILEHPAIKFVLFSLVPTIPAWRLHQFISYGGTFGEYYTFGLNAYLLGFAMWWISFSLSLVYLAAGMRAVVEAGSLAAAFAAPSAAHGVRRGLEILQRIAFYAGIPIWLLLRFTA